MAALMQDVSAVVLTHNEEANIKYCLESVKLMPFIYVVDSGSTDRTLEICREYTQNIFHHDYMNHSNQWRWTLDNVPLKTSWVLALDADFVVMPELLERIARDLPLLSGEIAGVYVRHLLRFGRGLIRYGGTKQMWLRLIRRGRARPDSGDFVDFRFVVDGKVATWPEAIVEYNRYDEDITVWSRKQDKFALRLAVEEEMRRLGLHGWAGKPKLMGTTDERITWLRDRWMRLPLFLRPVGYFLYRYVLMGGFLDGRAGFLYHSLQGFWLRLIVDWKTIELRALKLDKSGLETFARAMFKTRSGSVEEVRAVITRDEA